MKKICILLFVIWAQASRAQTVLIGDTTNLYVQRLNLILDKSSADFDFDCDGIKDITFDSYEGTYNPGYTTYSRISFFMSPNVEASRNPVYGWIQTYSDQQSVNLTSAFWDKNFSYIWGANPMAGYGITFTNKCIIFRKPNTVDTSYFFVYASTYQHKLIIHKVISSCSNTRILGVKKEFSTLKTKIYPNPFSEKLFIETIDDKPVDLIFYSLQGKIIKVIKNKRKGLIEVNDLAQGAYLIRINSEQGTITELFLKQ